MKIACSEMRGFKPQRLYKSVLWKDFMENSNSAQCAQRMFKIKLQNLSKIPSQDESACFVVLNKIQIEVYRIHPDSLADLPNIGRIG